MRIFTDMTQIIFVFKKIKKFLDFINKKDPKSIVIIQADHGIPDKKFTPNSIFTLVKIENCQNF